MLWALLARSRMQAIGYRRWCTDTSRCAVDRRYRSQHQWLAPPVQHLHGNIIMALSHTLHTLIDGLAEHDQRPAVVAFGREETRSWNFAELSDRARRLAAGLTQAGIRKGDVVALWAGNRPEWLAACLGVIRSGATFSPWDVQLGDESLTHLVNDSGARLIFTTSAKKMRIEGLSGRKIPELCLLDVEADDPQSWRRLLADEPEDLPAAAPDDVAVLFYTSGTTGPPKGVPLSHANLLFSVDSLLQSDMLTETDRVLLPLPMHHVYPFASLLAVLAAGLPLIFPAALTGPEFIRAVREGQATGIIGVPRLYRALDEAIASRAASAGRLPRALFQAVLRVSTWARRRLGLRLGKLLLRRLHREFGLQLEKLASGGAALDPELAWKLEGLGWRVSTGYGLTETSPLLTLDPPGHARLDTVGRPLPGVELRIDRSVLERTESSPRDVSHQQAEEGEVLARGPNVFAGYHHLPEKTKEAFTEDGWFRTGDLGYLDADGYLHITGRVKTLIVTQGGENIQSDQVEEAYAAAPLIREIGVLQEENQLVAVVQPEPSALATDEGDGAAVREAVGKAIKARSRELPSYQRITDFTLSRQPLPRTQLGKIRRHELAALYRHGKEGKEIEAAAPLTLEEMPGEDRNLLEDTQARAVWDMLVHRYPHEPLTLDTNPQLDLGVDSLQWLNLTLDMRERAGVELSEEALGRVHTIRDLLQEVTAATPGDRGPSIETMLEEPEEALSEPQRRWLEPLGAIGTGLARCLLALDRVLMRRCFRLRVEGLQRVPEQGPFVLAPNHASHLDSFALAAALDLSRVRQTYWAGWTGTAFKNPLRRLGSRLTHVVPIDPQKALFSSLAFGAAVLKRGQNLVWYPEGERSPTGELQAFKPGIGLLLAHEPVPVVPVYLHGTHGALPRGKHWPRWTQITVEFGDPLDPSDLERVGQGDQPHERITAALQQRVAELGGASEITQEAAPL